MLSLASVLPTLAGGPAPTVAWSDDPLGSDVSTRPALARGCPLSPQAGGGSCDFKELYFLVIQCSVDAQPCAVMFKASISVVRVKVQCWTGRGVKKPGEEPGLGEVRQG